jgi:membrane-associated protease RseP (regulator of RpoE activity)
MDPRLRFRKRSYTIHLPHWLNMDHERQPHVVNDPALDQFHSWPPAESHASDESELPVRSGFSDWVWPIGLFVATVFTTLWAGAYATNADPFVGAWRFLVHNPAALAKGIPFAGTLLGILVTHELGHYLLSRIHRVPVSLPLFIPGPPHFIGTFGAIIRMRGPILSRKALFDIGVAGPIAGFVVAVIALVFGRR